MKRWLKRYGLILVWLIGVAWMVASYYREPPPLDFEPSAYGVNRPGELQANLLRSTIEIALLAAIVRPWSFQRSINRLLLAIAVFLPWSFLGLLAAMHTGSIYLAHLFWLWLICGGLIVAVLAYFWSKLNRK